MLDGLVGLLLRASERTVFVLTRRIALVLTQQRIPLLNFGEKTHEAGVLDRHGELTLMFGTGAGDGTRGDLAVGRDESLKGFHIFVVNVLDVVLREEANLATGVHFLKSHCLEFLS